MKRVQQFRVNCSIRRLIHSGAKQVPYGYLDVTVKKPDLEKIGAVCTRQTATHFATLPGEGYCDLRFIGDFPRGTKHQKSIHAIKFQEHNTVRLGLAGLGHFEFMEFEETIAEFFPSTGELRIHYPPGLRLFQSGFFTGRSE